MNYKSWRLIGVLAIIGAVISLAIFAGMSEGPESYIRKNFKSVGTNTYRCEGDPKAVADQIAKNVRPKARATDSQTGEHFMRYSDKIVRVSGRGPTKCEIRMESDRHYRSGGFIYLGPGFNPSSPRGSSSGSSGSGGGVK